MLTKACKFIISNGPVTDQDRWEEDGGYSAFTMSVEITALNKASEMLDSLGLLEESDLAQNMGDIYAKNIDRWVYREHTDLASKYGVGGHYVRISLSDQESTQYIPIKNRPWSSTMARVEDVVSTGSLSLVRFGIKDAHDPKILNTVKIIDGELMTETPSGSVWHRYSKDGYGEHEDGSPFNGTGKGRGWPLLSGERANYEISGDNMDRALELSNAMEAFANDGGMIPEQVWDDQDIPSRGLYMGRPAGSAMPLVWAHAEYIKTAWGLENGRPYDQDQRILERYVKKGFVSRKAFWSFRNKSAYVRDADSIIFILQADAFIRVTGDNWKTMEDVNTTRLMDDLFIIDLDVSGKKTGEKIEFTFFWKDSERWEGNNFNIEFQITSTPTEHSE
jgi:Glucoamylase and related glycosyl hydrolases